MEELDGILNSLLPDNIQVWAMRSWTKHTEVHSLLDKLESASEKPAPAALHAATSLKTPTLYIFTSGTTGEYIYG